LELGRLSARHSDVGRRDFDGIRSTRLIGAPNCMQRIARLHGSLLILYYCLQHTHYNTHTTTGIHHRGAAQQTFDGNDPTASATTYFARRYIIMSKRKSDEIEKTDPVLLRTCSVCSAFCASWAAGFLCSEGAKYTGDHQGYLSDSDSESEGKKEPTKIGPPGSDGCTIEQCVALLCSLYKIGEKSQDFGIFSDPKFLKQCFKDLVHDKDKTISFAVLYSCNKIAPECYALPHKHGTVEIENRVGKLEAFRGHDSASHDEDDTESEESFQGPCQVKHVYADEAEHFVVTLEQWKELRNEEGCTVCPLYMSVFTYRKKESVDVNSILDSINII
jgi:hypothetical protein